jgi:peptidoglycan-N-acetylglucosamine deacetylase
LLLKPAISTIVLNLYTQKLRVDRTKIKGCALLLLWLIPMTACGLPGKPAGAFTQPAAQTVAAVTREVTPIAIRATATAPDPAITPAPSPTASAAPAAAFSGPALPVSSGRTDTNAVALTFDAGADVGYASLILDTLERNAVHASFGMTGQWAVAHPDLVSRMVSDGDQLLNHTWDHRSMTGLSTSTAPLSHEERVAELSRTDSVLSEIAGQSTQPYFRAPYGDQDASVNADAGRAGYHYDVLWSVDTGGWAGAPIGRIVAKSTAGAVPGAIIVMHVGAESQDGPALQSVIDVIRARGLQFVTVADLVG